MNPESFFCWWEERPLKGHRFFRWFCSPPPPPEKNLPWSRPLRNLVLGLILVAMALGARQYSPEFGLVSLVLALFIATAILVVSVFTVVSWNRRAARIRSGNPPPTLPRSLWTALFGLGYALLFYIATPYVLLTSFERARGTLQWKATQDALIAKGERLGFRELAGPAVPDDQNAAAIPLFREVMRTNSVEVMRTNGGMPLSQTGRLRMKVFMRPEEFLPEKPRKVWRPTTLQDWSNAFRSLQEQGNGTPDAVSKQDKTPRRQSAPRSDHPEYPVAPAGASAATVVLTSLQVAEPELEVIREASRLPFCRFDYAFEQGFQMLLPNLSALKRIQHHLDLRIQALVSDGQTNAAFEETLVALRISAWLREDPLLISHLVRIAQSQIASESIWHGIAAHCWTDAQLQEFQRQLAQRDYLAGLALALEGERNGAIQTMDQWIRDPKQIYQMLDANVPEISGVTFDQALFAAILPRGWIRQNQSALALETQRHIETARRLRGGTPGPEWQAILKQAEDRDAQEESRFQKNPSPYRLFARQLGAGLGRSVAKTVRASVMNQCAITGCALERYRLQKGSYPKTLDALVPDFLPAVPIDPMDGKPIRYAQTDNGLFRLWSVGDDREDQNGRRKDGTHRDWVWPAAYSD